MEPSWRKSRARNNPAETEKKKEQDLRHHHYDHQKATKLESLLNMDMQAQSQINHTNQKSYKNESRNDSRERNQKWKRFLFVAVDNSESMKGDKLTQVVSSLKKVIEQTPEHTKVVIRHFASQLKTLVTNPAEKIDLNRLVKDLQAKKHEVGAKTALYDAWGQIFDEVPFECYKTGTVHIMLFTDGIDTESKKDSPSLILKLVKDTLKKDNFYFTFVLAQPQQLLLPRLHLESQPTPPISIAETLKKQCGRNPRCRVVNAGDPLQEFPRNISNSTNVTPTQKTAASLTVNPFSKLTLDDAKKSGTKLTVADRFLAAQQPNAGDEKTESGTNPARRPAQNTHLASETSRTDAKREIRISNSNSNFHFLASKLGWN